MVAKSIFSYVFVHWCLKLIDSIQYKYFHMHVYISISGCMRCLLEMKASKVQTESLCCCFMMLVCDIKTGIIEYKKAGLRICGIRKRDPFILCYWEHHYCLFSFYVMK